MPSNDLRVECRIQEIVFLGYLYTHPEELPKYISLLDEVRAFQSKAGQHMWGILHKYYMDYGALPSEDIWPHTGMTNDEIDDLTIAVGELSWGSPDYKFMLDTFTDTLQLAVYRNATEEFETTMQNGGEKVLDKLKNIEDKMLSRLLVCRNADKSTLQGSLRGTLQGWFEGGLLFQQPKVAVPIEGMENVSGSPKGSVNLLVGGYGSGKFGPISLVIPTPYGFKRWGDLKPGDYVFGVHGKPTKILQTFPQGRQDIYRVTFDDGSSTLCGKEHLWTVYGKKERRYDKRRGWPKVSWRVMTTQQIIDEGVTLKHGKCQPHRQWEVPRIRPVEYMTNPELPIHPYVLGLWLGDGDSSGCLTINRGHQEVITYLDSVAGLVSHKPAPNKFCDKVRVKSLASGLSKLYLNLCSCWEKYIPQQYLEASVEDRYELLRGLLDSDGECALNGVTLVYGSASQKLVEQVLFLARSLGGKGSMRAVKHPTFTYKGEKKQGRPSYSCSFVLPPEFGCPFRSVPKRAERYKGVTEERYLIRYIDKIEKLDYQEECMCIKVEAEDGLYLANDFIPTHNTTTMASMTAYLLHNYNVLYVTLETNADAIVFKILSNLTGGKVRSKSVHELPKSEKITSQELEALQAFKVAFDKLEPTREDEAVEVELGGMESLAHLKTLFHLTMSPGTATANQLEIYAREIQRKTGLHIDAIMVDYAALMKTNSGGSKDDIGWSYTGTIMMELAAIAQNLGLVIWTAAQAGGQIAHTVMNTTTTAFKPIRGADVYGSKEVLQNSSLVYGLSVVRSAHCPHIAVGVLSTLKNRYGTEFYDYICTMNYSTSTLKVVEIYDAYTAGDGGLVEKVYTLLKKLEQEYDTRTLSQLSEADLKRKQKVEALSQSSESSETSTVDVSSIDVSSDGYRVQPGEVGTYDPSIVINPDEGRVVIQNGVPVRRPRLRKSPVPNNPPEITASAEQRTARQVVQAVKVMDTRLKTASKEDKNSQASTVLGAKLGQRSSTDSPF